MKRKKSAKRTPSSKRSAPAPVRQRDADATRAKILQAALAEFGSRGLPETRTDDIAARCKVNKRMIYYYFGSKEGLYLAALESVYEELVRLEREIEVEHLDPVAALEAMINLKIDYYIDNPQFISFLTMENLYQARNLRKSKKLEAFKTPLTQVIARILERGEREGLFRRNVDAVDLYISICALGFMYFANRHTLGAIFARDLMTGDAIDRRRQSIIDMVLGYLKGSNTLPLVAAPRKMRSLEPLAL
jgi:AcrR family transcriptional regulator